MFEPDDLIGRYRVPDRSAPHLRVNFIASLDGAGTIGGLSGGLNDEWDKQVFDTLRLLSDVVIVGAGTARAEGYGALALGPAEQAWRLRAGMAAQPVFALVSARLDLDPDGAMFTKAPTRPLVLTCAAAPADARARLSGVADVIECGATSVQAQPLRQAMIERGLPQMLCEGGPRLFGTLLDGDAVDEMCLTIAPVLAGGDSPRISVGAAERARQMRLQFAMPGGPMLFLRYLADAH